MAKRKPVRFWDSLDYSRPVAELARENGFAQSSIVYQARKRGFDPVFTKLSPTVLAPFADRIGVWSDQEVAAAAGCSRQAVQQWRHNRGIPSPPKRPRLSTTKAVSMLAEIVLRGGAPTDQERATLALFVINTIKGADNAEK